MKTPAGLVVFDLTKSIPSGQWRTGVLCKHRLLGLGKVVAVDAEARTATVHFLFWVSNPDAAREPGLIFRQDDLTLLTDDSVALLRDVIEAETVDADAFDIPEPWFPPAPYAPLPPGSVLGEETFGA